MRHALAMMVYEKLLQKWWMQSKSEQTLLWMKKLKRKMMPRSQHQPLKAKAPLLVAQVAEARVPASES